MNREEILKSIKNKDDKILLSNLIDKYIKNKKNIDTYSNFLDIRELKLVTNIFNKYKVKFNIYKPIEECEKSIVYFGNYNDFVTIYKIINNDFKHKDILGTLFSLGYNYDVIGDIIINDKYVYLTNLSRLNKFLETNILMIKNKYIELEKTNEIIVPNNKFDEFNIIISSNRLDTIVSKLANTSRNNVLNLFKNKMVLLNYETVDNQTKKINENDIISIRKIGKFMIGKNIGKTKKDNIIIEIKKYQ